MNESSQENKPVILIVDDTPANLHLLFEILSGRGYYVHAVSNGRAALESVRISPPDLILLDVMMPEMDGYEVCRHLQADEQTRDIPVLFISALDAVQDKVKAFRAGGVDYIHRPFQIEEILARVQTHLRLRELKKELAERNAQLEQVNAQLLAEVDQRRQAQASLHQLTVRLQILREIDQAILGAQSSLAQETGHLLPTAILGRLAQLIPCRRISVIEFGLDGQPRLLAAQTIREFQGHAADWPALVQQALGVGGHILGVGDLNSLPRRSPLQERLVAEGICAYLIVPLTAQEQALGALTVESDLPNPWTPEHVNTAAEVAAMLAIAIQQVQLRTLLKRRTVELEAQNAELDAFAHTVAHDLRNPLVSLIGYGTLLIERGGRYPPDKVVELSEYIVQSARKMNSIIDELLLLAGVRGMEKIPIAPLDMNELIRQSRERIRHLIDEYRPEILLPDRWPSALGYGPWVEEVWVNYFSNAIKYGGTPPRVEFGADPPFATPDGQWVRFWVRDNGAGLTREQQAQLFTPFEQLGQVRTRGYGLGLSIVKRIVERLGGQVGVESEPGQGSLFYFTLPAADALST